MSQFFKDSEFACKCGCNYCNPDGRLLLTLDMIRAALGKPVIVTSGCRCQQHNARGKGVVAKKYYIPGTKQLDLSKYPKGLPGEKNDSNHTHGTAADIQCSGLTAKTVWTTIMDLYKAKQLPYIAGLGRYDTFNHVDVDPKVQGRLRQWDERTKK